MKLLYYCLIFVQTWKALSCQSIYPIQGETSAIIVSPFSRFRFVISMYCESTIFLPCKCVTSEAKESFCFENKNAPLVGTLISVDDVSESIAISRGFFNQGKRESCYIRKRFQHTHRTAGTPTRPPFHCFRTDQYGFKGYKFYKHDTKCKVKVYISHMVTYRISQLYLQNECIYTKWYNK